MDYKGHPVIEENSYSHADHEAAFHERRGHGAIRETVSRGAASSDTGHAVRSNSESADGVLADSQTDSGGAPGGLPNGVWTIEGPRGHRTFRISTVLAPGSPQTSEYSPASQGDLSFRERHHGKRVLELLTGPDNTASYRGLAWIVDPATRADHSCVGKLWKLGLQSTLLVNTFCKLVERNEAVEGYTVHFARHCYKCNRLLTTPESIQRGIGPVCARGGWD